MQGGSRQSSSIASLNLVAVKATRTNTRDLFNCPIGSLLPRFGAARGGGPHLISAIELYFELMATPVFGLDLNFYRGRSICTIVFRKDTECSVDALLIVDDTVHDQSKPAQLIKSQTCDYTIDSNTNKE